MKKVFRILGIVIIIMALLVVGVRGFLGLSFVMGSRNFYPPAGQFLNPKTQAFHFNILSDTGSQNRTLERLICEAKTTHPAFMLHLGDLVTYRNIEHMYWMASGMEDKLEGIPMYIVPGNHDVKKKKGIDKSMYLRVFGPTYYWFGYGNTLFIGLDSSTEEIDDEQWAFFEQVMQHIRPSFKHVILFTHVPPKVPEGQHQHSLKPESAEKMLKILKKYPVDVIFSGHVHYYSEQDLNGIPIYTVPPSGQYFGGPIHKFGYLRVDVDEKGVHVQNVYSDRAKAQELLEILFVDTLLTDKVRWIADAILGLGLLFFVLGQKKLSFHRFKRKSKIETK